MNNIIDKIDNIESIQVHDNISIFANDTKYKSIAKLGNLTFYNTKSINKFHRFMWKLCFGVNIYDYPNNKEKL